MGAKKENCGCGCVGQDQKGRKAATQKKKPKKSK